MRRRNPLPTYVFSPPVITPHYFKDSHPCRVSYECFSITVDNSFSSKRSSSDPVPDSHLSALNLKSDLNSKINPPREPASNHPSIDSRSVRIPRYRLFSCFKVPKTRSFPDSTCSSNANYYLNLVTHQLIYPSSPTPYSHLRTPSLIFHPQIAPMPTPNLKAYFERIYSHLLLLL